MRDLIAHAIFPSKSPIGSVVAKMLLIHIFGLLFTIASVTAASQKHHKVRHKHNSFNLRGNHVNKIREAFDEYRNIVHKTNDKNKIAQNSQIKNKNLWNEFDEAIEKNVKFDGRSDWVGAKPNEIRQGNRNEKYVSVNSQPHEYFYRPKRVFTSTTRAPWTTHKAYTKTIKSIDDSGTLSYDEEYADDENDASNRRINDDSQAGSLRLNRDNSENQRQFSDDDSLTDFKYRTLGTPDVLQKSFQEELRNQQRNNAQDIHHNIRQNILRTRNDGMCRWPGKRVMEMPQHASKMFNPRKYVIYQCSDDTSCCGSSDKTCVAKKTEEIVLWFHVRFVDSTGVEPLKVVNHTECECIYKNRQAMPRTSRIPYAWPKPTVSTTTAVSSCKCPTHFEPDINDDDCGCICKDSKAECRQRFEGKEGFTISDQRCIFNHACTEPHCLHGTYSTTTGRCPDKNDKINKGFQGSREMRQSN